MRVLLDDLDVNLCRVDFLIELGRKLCRPEELSINAGGHDSEAITDEPLVLVSLGDR